MFSFWWKTAFITGFVAIGINLALINYTLLQKNTAETSSSLRPSNIVETRENSGLTTFNCGEECQKEIETRVDKAIRIATKSMTLTVTSSPTKSSNPTVVANQLAKEFFIPFGSGSTMSENWVDLAGLEGYIDTAKYGAIKEVYFEASLRIPTKNGRVYARLYNVTDKHPVWFSELSTENDTGTLLSAKINLDPGGKIYRVQMKTSLRYESILDQSRLRIVIK